MISLKLKLNNIVVDIIIENYISVIILCEDDKYQGDEEDLADVDVDEAGDVVLGV